MGGDMAVENPCTPVCLDKFGFVSNGLALSRQARSCFLALSIAAVCLSVVLPAVPIGYWPTEGANAAKRHCLGRDREAEVGNCRLDRAFRVHFRRRLIAVR